MRITIGVPFHNDGQYLLDCVRSIFAQTEQDWELLLVDDGSTDDSLQIARSIDDPRVRVLSDGHNRGLAARLNEIAELARGEFIARHDADDLMHPLRLADQVARLEDCRHAEAVGSPWISIDGNSEVVGRSQRGQIDLRPESVIRRVPLAHGTILCRRTWMRRIPYNTELRRAQDRDFWIRAVAIGRSHVEMLDEPRYFYRILERVPLAKTLEGYRTDRQVLGKFGPDVIGPWRTKAWICESYAKTALWNCARSTPLSKWLSRARSVPIEAAEREEAEQVLQQLASQDVPRWGRLQQLVRDAA